MEDVELCMSLEDDRIAQAWETLIKQRFHDIAPNLSVGYINNTLMINFGGEVPKRHLIIKWVEKMISKNGSNNLNLNKKI